MPPFSAGRRLLLAVTIVAIAHLPALILAQKPKPTETPTEPGSSDRMAKGPLRIHPQNPRYFTDGTKTASGSLRAVYLTGSHTWGNLCDYPPEKYPPFDYRAYLDFLGRYHHNFFRLWPGNLDSNPSPYERPGPGEGSDGRPRGPFPLESGVLRSATSARHCRAGPGNLRRHRPFLPVCDQIQALADAFFQSHEQRAGDQLRYEWRRAWGRGLRFIHPRDHTDSGGLCPQGG